MPDIGIYTYSYQPVTYTYTCSMCLRSPAVHSCIILLYGVSITNCIPSLFEHLLGSDDYKISTRTDVNTYYTSYIGRRKQLYVYNIIIQIGMCPVVRGQLIHILLPFIRHAHIDTRYIADAVSVRRLPPVGSQYLYIYY